MQKYLITTVSAIGLLLGAMATAQDRSTPSAQSPAANSPGAGATQRDGNMQPDQSGQQRQGTINTAPGAAGNMESAGSKSYTVNRDKLAGASTKGGVAPDTLLGASVTSASDGEIGEVVDLLVGPDDHIGQAIVEVGGFLGIGSRTVAVDLETLRERPGTGQGLTTNSTEDELKKLPEYRLANGIWVRSAR